MELSKIYASNADSVFDRTVRICKELGYRVDSVNNSIRRIKASVGASLFSYGEEIEIIVSHQGESQAAVHVNAKPKVWFNITSDTSTPVRRIFDKLDATYKEAR